MSSSIEIDRIALWRKTGVSGLTKRVHPAGTPVIERGASVISPSKDKVYRYAKDYALCTLFARTYHEDDDAVEARLDEVAGNLTDDQIAAIFSRTVMINPQDFEYLDEYLTEEK